MDQFVRVIEAIGQENFQKIQQIHVCVIGIGGVGSFAVETLVRTGIKKLTIIDYDDYDISNLNRQWPSNTEIIGQTKVSQVAREAKKINPEMSVEEISTKLTIDNYMQIMEPIIKGNNVYVIECIDDTRMKVLLTELFVMNKTAFISSMGAANISDITKVRYADLSKTEYCRVAHKLRKELRKKKIYKGIPVVYSPEERIKNPDNIKGSLMSMTATFGIYLAQWVIKKVTEPTD